MPPIRYRLGFLGAWTLAAIASGVVALAGAAELANLSDQTRIARLERIDRLIGSRVSGTVTELKGATALREDRVRRLQSQVARAVLDLEEPPDAAQTILVSTAENRLWVRRGRRTVLQAVVSTGKGTTLMIAGRKMIFDTPSGRFRIRSKEKNPVWVPPDWHYVEEARRKKLDLIRVKPGDLVDAETGQLVAAEGAGVWSLLGKGERRPRRVLKVGKDSIVEMAAEGPGKEIEAREFLRAGKALIVPPLGFKQRRFEKTLGRYRLNLGDGYALHGTLATGQLGRSVSHGCVRLADQDLEKLFEMSRIGDEVIIY
jgi:lipoprotein-anchoring transpeptidase ErfK/SrfK